MRGVLVLLLIFLCHHQTDAVKCNDGCATFSDVVKQDGSSQKLPDGLKACSDSTLVDCAEGQVCISTPVGFSALVSVNDKTVESSAVTFTYSACSGDAKVDCAKIGDKIFKMYNGTDFTTQFGKMSDFGKQMEEWRVKMNELGAQMEKNMKTAFSGFGSIFGYNWINNFVKRDEDAPKPAAIEPADKNAAKPAVKAKPVDEEENGGSSASLKSHSLILGDCKESTIERT
ncbi:uncharacterized protein LOC134825181 isoform X2 [Bolinopsis microptera]|uniref:uncharacterized protein LOC134825181 isoform X2 n=1 Tax=Bolinopsis microptera TaxID=2820187 RepID=UPI003079FCF9